MLNELQKAPRWLFLTVGLLMVIVLGVADYLTGDYSILIFYAIPVALAAWTAGRWGGMLIGFASGIARLTSDYMTYLGPRFKYWNSLQDMVFLLMFGIIISVLRELIDDDKRQ